MLNVSGIISIVRNAGTAIIGSVQAISAAFVIIMLPTRINAGAVAAEGITPTSGATNRAARNSSPVTIAVTPLRPPAATPAELSI